MKYATVCSGIGAPEQAWSDLWGPPEFTSEIEAFPSAVLRHHYPDVPNHGDMTKYKEWPDHEQLGLICGGTPCQSFSVAGLRQGLDDPRGNLTLVFLGLIARYNPRWVVWENVPGVFSSGQGADLRAFLAGLAELGYSSAYRVLDAQFFGVPQRRRRVFVIGYIGDWRPPFAVLSEPQSLRGNTPKGRKAGQEVARCLRGQPQSSHSEDSDNFIAHPLMGEGYDASEDGTGRGIPIVMAHGQGGAEINKDGSPSLTCNHEAPILFSPRSQDGHPRIHDDICPTLDIMSGGGRQPCVAIHARQDPITVKDKSLPLDTKGNTQDIAIHPHAIGRKDEAGPQAKPYRTDDKAYTHDSRGVAQAVAFAQNTRDEVRLVGGDGSIAGALAAEPGMKQTTYIKTGPIVRRLTPRECERLQGFPDDFTLIPEYGARSSMHYDEVYAYLVASGYKGNKFTEALAKHPDGIRYKALGNSMAVPVVRWIGERIQMWEELHGRT